MIRTTFFATIILGLAGCASAPTQTQLAGLSNSDLCYYATRSGPTMSSTGRVIMGVFTLGMTELSERTLEKYQEAYQAEVIARNLGSCSSDEVATAECKKIYSNTDTPDFKKCVLDISLSISTSHTAADAKANAIAARRAAAYTASQQIQQQMNSSTWESKPVENICCK